MLVNKYRYQEEAGGNEGSSDTSSSDNVDSSGSSGGDVSSGSENQGSGEKAGFWPDDWQQRLAGEDKTLQNIAGRYASPEALFKGYVALQNDISSGRLRKSLGENPSDEDVKSYRESNGIPVEPSKYEIKNVEISEENKEVFEDLTKVAHSANLTNDQLNSMVAYFQDYEQEIEQARSELDQEEQDQARVDLKVEWGGNYDKNMNKITAWMDKYMPEKVREAFQVARMPDGTRLFNQPDVVRGFADAAVAEFGQHTVLSGDYDSFQGIEGRIAEIQHIMRTDRKQYNSNQAMQDEFRELLARKERLKKTG